MARTELPMRGWRTYILRAVISFGLAVATAFMGDIMPGDPAVLYGAAGGFVVYGMACTFDAIDSNIRGG